jgi:hypothetical protein
LPFLPGSRCFPGVFFLCFPDNCLSASVLYIHPFTRTSTAILLKSLISTPVYLQSRLVLAVFVGVLDMYGGYPALAHKSKNYRFGDLRSISDRKIAARFRDICSIIY